MVDILKSYILQNWILILVLGAFAIILFTSVFLNNKATTRMLILILSVFALSIIVFAEFYITPTEENIMARKILMSIRYSATPFIIALVTFALVKHLKGFIFIPAAVLLIIDVVSIFTGIVFDIKNVSELVRGPLGFLPYIVASLYMIFLIYILIKRSNKRAIEIIPIVFLTFALLSGLIFPLFLGPSYAQIFCTIIAVALFIYHVFLILQISKKDPLTGLLNRQAYNVDIERNEKDVSAIVSVDMNELKDLNDTFGHAAGDEALSTIGLLLLNSCKAKQTAYRVGGDEFLIVCLKMPEDEVKELVDRIKKYVADTKYTCSVGYSYNDDGKKSTDQLLKESDEAMYAEKEAYYRNKK